MQELAPLLGRTLVLVAHQDDETLGCGALIQRMRSPLVVYATDGAPLNEKWWKPYGSRQAYADVRRSEALGALAALGVEKFEFLADYAPGVTGDQQLFHYLPRIY